jgi:CRISPR system Cascade subunit CasA
MGLSDESGIGLLWLVPWSGEKSLAFSSLDPFYIEICRRIRFISQGNRPAIGAIATGSKAARIEAKDRNGITGDPWMPVDIAAGKALTITGEGFHYKLVAELLFGNKFLRPIAQVTGTADGPEGIVGLAQGITRGEGKTEGYHERRIPVSPKVRRLLLQKEFDLLAAAAGERVKAIAKIRGVLWTALATLFDQGAVKDGFSDGAKNKASDATESFEQGEDSRFFEELNAEIESQDPDRTRLQWLLSMAERAEIILKNAFIAGPQSAERRYRARSTALARFYGGLRSGKTIPILADYYCRLTTNKEDAHEPA